MNGKVSATGAVIVTATVFLFALFIIIGFPAGQYLVCALLPIGYIMMAAGLRGESSPDRRVPADIGLILAAIYAVLVLLVYFSQNTTVRLDDLSEQAGRILVFKPGSLTFYYDLLGYGMMALSTFFIGLSFKAESKPDKWLRYLIMIHGAFFPGCFFMPMTGIFSSHTEGGSGIGGSLALLFWCLYFLPIGVLAFRHFIKNTSK